MGPGTESGEMGRSVSVTHAHLHRWGPGTSRSPRAHRVRDSIQHKEALGFSKTLFAAAET